MRGSKSLSLVGLLRGDTSGNVALLFCLIVVPLTLTAGSGIDYARATAIRSTLQSAVDSAALAGASAYTSASASAPARTMGSNYLTLGTNPLLSSVTLGTPTVVSGTQTSSGITTGYTITATISASVPTTLMALFTPSMTVNATATAVRQAAGAGACILALAPSASGAITLSGNASFSAPSCDIAANSTSTSALTISGGGSVSAHSAYLGGNYSGNATSLTLSQPAHINYSALIADPYAGAFGQPTLPLSCAATNFQLNGNSNLTINPGRYCGGISKSSGGTLSLRPGTYYLDSGDFSVSGGSVVCTGCGSGLGITLVLTATNPNNIGIIKISGSSNVDLQAPGPSSGEPYPGIVIYQDPRIPTGSQDSISGSATTQFTGVIYLPNTGLSLSGSSTMSTPPAGRACRVIISRTLTLTGGTDVGDVTDCSLYGALTPGVSKVKLVQ